jgi:signal transduction histidine kinase
MTDFNLIENIEYCRQIVEEVAPILFYTHIPTAFITLLLGIFVFTRKKGSLLAKIFLGISLSFVFWTVCNLSIWLNFDLSSIVMFAWSPIEMFSVLIYALSFYFAYVFAYDHDVSIYAKIVALLVFLPIPLSTFLGYNISYFDLNECVAVEHTFISYYAVGLKILISFSIVILAMVTAFDKQVGKAKQIILLNSGLVIFLISFFAAGYYAETTGNYQIEMFGLLGVLFFIGILAFLIVRYHTFDIKLLGAEMLVVILVVTVFSQLLFIEGDFPRLLVIVSGVLSLFFGYLLTKSVQKEVALREDLEVVNTRLIDLDKQKSEFVSFATHQLKSPLAAMKGYASLVLDGDYGEVNKDVKEAVSRIFESSKTLANVVEDYLNISRIELGTMKYDFVDQDIKNTVEDVIAGIEPNIKKTGIQFSFTAEPDDYTVSADPDKIKQVYMNLIDNSIKYTPTGKVEVFLKKENKKVIFSVVDTGIGMKPNTIESLFQKFTRAYNANKTNIHGTGLGLYVARQIAEAHHGKVWAMSEGEGKGSQFYVELDAKN